MTAFILYFCTSVYGENQPQRLTYEKCLQSARGFSLIDQEKEKLRCHSVFSDIYPGVISCAEIHYDPKKRDKFLEVNDWITNCYARQALHRKEDKYCLQATKHPNAAAGEEARCLSKLAQLQKKSQPCQLLKSKSEKSLCRFESGYFNEKDCHLIAPRYVKNQCLAQLALKTQKKSYCLKMDMQAQKNLCFKSVAVEKERVDSCLDLEGQLKRQCVVGVTKRLGQLSSCLKHIKSEKSCVRAISKTNQKVEVCEQIKSELYRGVCVANVAIATKNYQLCQGLKSEGRALMCPGWSPP